MEAKDATKDVMVPLQENTVGNVERTGQEKCSHEQIVVEYNLHFKKTGGDSFTGVVEYERDLGSWPVEQYHVKCLCCGEFIDDMKIKLV